MCKMYSWAPKGVIKIIHQIECADFMVKHVQLQGGVPIKYYVNLSRPLNEIEDNIDYPGQGS